MEDFLEGLGDFIPVKLIAFVIFAAILVVAFKFFIKFAFIIVPVVIAAAIWYFNRDKINKFFANNKQKVDSGG